MKDEQSNLKWIIFVLIITFCISLLVSFVCSVGLDKLSILPAIFILLLVIFIGIIFDIIAVSVMIANEHTFHAKATKKVNGAKKAVKLIRNCDKVSNFCADIIGDICGVLSGSISALISLKITQQFNLTFNLQIFISAIVASLTVSGKAIGKSIAKNNCDIIVDKVSKILHIFDRKK
jgi:CBS domain containing-hemolysin-like protein